MMSIRVPSHFFDVYSTDYYGMDNEACRYYSINSFIPCYYIEKRQRFQVKLKKKKKKKKIRRKVTNEHIQKEKKNKYEEKETVQS